MSTSMQGAEFAAPTREVQDFSKNFGPNTEDLCRNWMRTTKAVDTNPEAALDHGQLDLDHGL
jgi:hypothetical protein